MICLRANESEIILHTIFTCVSTLHVYIFQFDDEISYVRAVVRVCVCCLDANDDYYCDYDCCFFI